MTLIKRDNFVCSAIVCVNDEGTLHDLTNTDSHEESSKISYSV